jgi:hypothetical protein
VLTLLTACLLACLPAPLRLSGPHPPELLVLAPITTVPLPAHALAPDTSMALPVRSKRCSVVLSLSPSANAAAPASPMPFFSRFSEASIRLPAPVQGGKYPVACAGSVRQASVAGAGPNQAPTDTQAGCSRLIWLSQDLNQASSGVMGAPTHAVRKTHAASSITHPAQGSQGMRCAPDAHGADLHSTRVRLQGASLVCKGGAR